MWPLQLSLFLKLGMSLFFESLAAAAESVFKRAAATESVFQRVAAAAESVF